MLDHVFTDAIGALRDAMELAFLERQAFEERFQTDFLLGDMSWETSYGLPGEGMPPRVQVHVACGWPTWSQTAYRSWYVDEELTEAPRIDIDLAVRIQRLAGSPEPKRLLDVIPTESADMGGTKLIRSGPTIETIFNDDLSATEYAIEVHYEGSYEVDEASLNDGSALDEHFNALGGWIASVLVKVGDVGMNYLPAIDN